jgi:hypothetical protein
MLKHMVYITTTVLERVKAIQLRMGCDAQCDITQANWIGEMKAPPHYTQQPNCITTHK